MCLLLHTPGVFAVGWMLGTSIKSTPLLTSPWVCPPFLAQVSQPPWEVLSTHGLLQRRKAGLYPFGCQHPIPASPFPCARAVPGSCEPAPGLISVESMPALLPCIDLINEELPMVFSTLLSVKITF